MFTKKTEGMQVQRMNTIIDKQKENYKSYQIFNFVQQTLDSVIQFMIKG